MPDLLILSTNTKLGDNLEVVAKRLGFRTRSTQELQTVDEWLKVRSFDVAVIEIGMPLKQQIQFTSSLWRRNINTFVIVVDPSDDGTKDASEMRFLGAEIVRGSDIERQFENCLVGYLESQNKSGSDFNVLVVDDLDSPRDIICIYLEALGDDVKAKGVASAAEALIELESYQYQCVFTDIKMPQMNGDELIREIRKHETLRHLPVIVLTAFGSADWLVECLKSGASGFLVKPPKKADLAKELAKARHIIQQKLSPALVRAEDRPYIEEILREKGLY